MVEKIMNLDWELVGTIGVPIIALFIGALLNKWLENRPKLIIYLGNVSSFTIGSNTENPTKIRTHSLILRNAGKKAANNVVLFHPYLPDYQMQPAITHEIRDVKGGGKELKIPLLVPQEQISISYLYFPPTNLEEVSGLIKSDQGVARVIKVIPAWQFPNWIQKIVGFLLLMGVVSILLLVYLIFRWIIP